MLRDQCNRPDQEVLIIHNVSYRPDLQAAELYWAACKHRYRNAVTDSFLNQLPIDHYKLVSDIMESIPKM